MKNLKNRHKILSLILLGLILISILILLDISNMTNPTQNQKSLTHDNLTSEEKSPTQDDIIPQPSAPAPDIKYTKIFNITQSTDDAERTLSGQTSYNRDLILLGGLNGLDASFGIGLRWNIDVPKGARIIKAYINLTVAKNDTGALYNGFETKIWAFNEPSTNDFSSTALLKDRPLWGSPYFSWYPPVPVSTNQTLQTSNIKDLVDHVMNLDGWDGIFGVYIFTYSETQYAEFLEFWSYDHGNLAQVPKLIIEWEESPYFTEVPTDITINNETLGYHINWTAKDNNPLDYYIIGNETINGSPEIVQSGEWQNGETIRYDIPKIDIKNYDLAIVNYTLYVYDVDGYFEYDTVFINVTDKGLPTMTDIKFIQNNREVDHFQPSGGPFSMRIYGSETALFPKVTLSASFPYYEFEIWKVTYWGPPGYIADFNISIYCEADTANPFIYPSPGAPNFPYNSEQGCWELTPNLEEYNWKLALYQETDITATTWWYNYYIPVQDIRYNVKNKFLIGIMGGIDPEFVSEGRVYGDVWGKLKYEILNKDLTPPIFAEPEFIEPDEPDKHYEININVATEKNGAVVEDVFLYYSVNDGIWEEVKMVLRALGETKYYGEIPPQPEDSEITYYIRIVDKAGNVAETDEYKENAAIFEEVTLIVPMLGVFIAILGSLSIVAIYRHKSKAALKKHPSEKSSKKSEKVTKKGNKLLQKIKKVRKKQ